jgi:DNA helicase-2/ATP-dependent DNA helicase PcrA
MSLRSLDLDRLNDAQRAAVIHDPDRPLLVLAAAGTGKTEVLTTRIAAICQRSPASRVLAVTFSRKAAREMQARSSRMLRARVGPEYLADNRTTTVCTFHALCVKILRMRRGFMDDFTILDAADAAELMSGVLDAVLTRILRSSSSCDPSALEPIKPASVLRVLNRWRNGGHVGPWDVPPPAASTLSLENVAYLCFKPYRAACAAANAIDFADLISHAVALLRAEPELRERVRQRWTHVLVDEFQDTNAAQLELVRLVLGERMSVTAVGDDSQTIHEHAGADVRRILEFDATFGPGAATVKLEQNYRSRQSIIDAANSAISRNVNRVDKQLVCTRGGGPYGDGAVRVLPCEDDHAEARAVARDVDELVRSGKAAYRDVCVLYRINALSAPLEAALRAKGVPFRTVGGVAFFERAEVRDALAHLHAAANPRLDAHVLRALASVPCGVGKTTLSQLQQGRHASLLDAVRAGAAEVPCKRAARGLRTFVESVLGISEPPLHLRTYADVDAVMYDCEMAVERLVRHLSTRRGQAEQDQRVENVRQLLAHVRRAAQVALADVDEGAGEGAGGRPATTLADVLQHVYEQDGSENDDGDEDDDSDVDSTSDNRVSLLSVHRSKGLEWPHVYVVGFAEGVFPFRMALDEGNVEGERRLAYVALTRARERVTLSYPCQRAAAWGVQALTPSRFVHEIEVGRP